MLIDTHAHLSDTRFDEDRAAALERARAAGVGMILEVGCDPDDWEKVSSLCEGNPSLRCILGIHPQDAQRADDELFTELETRCRRTIVAGIGETGLDYHFEYSPRDVQKAVFRRHLELAGRIGKPIVIHCREAYHDLLEILRPLTSPLRGVVHCFSGSLMEAEELVARGLLLGIDGPVTYPKTRVLKECVAKIPLEKLLLETDSPYLPPQPFRGQRNEPAYVRHVAEEVARIKGVSLGTVAGVTTDNARKLFGLTEKEG